MNDHFPRGIRNHNPGNIRLSKIRWQGQKPQQFDSDFIEFESAVMGLRALMKTLLTYFRRHQLDTVQAIINRWAPPHENATDHYAGHVSKRLEVTRTTRLNLEDESTLMGLAKAIVMHENGYPNKKRPKFWYCETDYKKACKMALSKGE